MIKLDVNPYCHGCHRFNPTVNKLYSDNTAAEQTVTCLHKDICEGIELNIRREIAKEKENA